MQKLVKKPLVTVVIPVFNGARYLAQAVHSTQKSTFKDFEIFLIDDGSEDSSREMCRAFATKYKNIRFHTFARNQGLGNALNHALKHGRGKYICRINQDDRMLPHRILKQVEFLESHPEVVACGSWIKLFFEETEDFEIVKFLPTDEKIKNVWLYLSPFADPSVMYRRDVALEVGGYEQEFWPADDSHLWYKMGMRGKLANIQEPLVEVRYHTKAASVHHFRQLIKATHKMHMWAHENVQYATFWVRVFWVAQTIAGFIFSPNANWKIYRIIKRLVNCNRQKTTSSKRQADNIVDKAKFLQIGTHT